MSPIIPFSLSTGMDTLFEISVGILDIWHEALYWRVKVFL